MKKNRKYRCDIRHRRVRKKVFGTSERPRLNVFRSAKNIYAQLIDDTKGYTIAQTSSLSKEFKEQANSGGNIKAAKLVGALIASIGSSKGIEKVVFDRGGYIYHGRIKALADSARENGFKF